MPSNWHFAGRHRGPLPHATSTPMHARTRRPALLVPTWWVRPWLSTFAPSL